MDKSKKERIKKLETIIWEMKKVRKITKNDNKYKKERKKRCNQKNFLSLII